MRLQAASLVLALAAAAPAAAGQMQTLQVGGVTREYYLHVPAALPDAGARPLVIMLHGAGGNGRQAVRRYRWEDKAAQEHFIVAGPDAWRLHPDQPADLRTNPRFWNDQAPRGGPGALEIDDVAFIGALIDTLVADKGIDRSRIYVVGFSSGAGMTQRLAAELADRIAAVAPVSGIVQATSATPSRPLPFFYISGDADPLNPVAGGMVNLAFWGLHYPKTAHAAILERWRQIDGCSADERKEAPAAGVAVEVWSGCTAGTEVRYALIHRHGHHWPGEKGAGLPEAMVGPRSTALDATDTIWQFVSRYRLP